MSFKDIVDETKKDLILTTYRQNNWSTTKTAKALGTSRQTLLRAVRRLGLREIIDQERDKDDEN